MYRYDEFDAQLVNERVAQFKGQVARRMTGDMTEDQFKPLRLMNGVYLQLHAYMLRVAVPYGTMNAAQMSKLAFIARKYDKNFGHFTTRQNIQFNWPALTDIPAILDHLSDVEMHAIQTSGNCIRNVTTDQYAGVAKDEIEDPRIWCEIIRQWSTFHPEFTYLPRKFKIAVTASAEDRAAIKFHDIGLQILKNDAGEIGFKIFVGGGLGRTPHIGEVVKDFVPKEDLLHTLEAILQVYNLNGRRDNLYKARIKITIREMGVDAFTKAVDATFAKIKHLPIHLPKAEIARISDYFAAPNYVTYTDQELENIQNEIANDTAKDTGFANWLNQQVKPHRQAGYSIVDITLKPQNMAPGDITADQMDVVAEVTKRYSFDELRSTHEQNLVLPYVAQADLYALYKTLNAHNLAGANAGLITDIIACPGLDYCNLANTRSIPVANMLQDFYANEDVQQDIGALKIKISGCINACGHHHVGHIGILGVDKKGEEYFQITLGGNATENAAVGEIVGRGIPESKMVAAIDMMVQLYKNQRQDGEDFIATVARIGTTPFKEAFDDFS